MKQLFAFILSIMFLCSCSKEVQAPLDTSQPTNKEDAISKLQKRSVPKTISYTNEYYGDSGEGFDITFPAFNVNTETLTGWTMTVTRKITGTISLSNSLTTRNDSSIAISRFLCVTMSPQTICTCPSTVMKYLPQRLAGSQSLTVNVNTTVTDVVNCVPANMNFVQGDATGKLTWHFSDLISEFKPNCNNSSALEDAVTIKVTYSYIQN